MAKTDLPRLLDLLASPLQELDRDVTDGATIDETQQHFLEASGDPFPSSAAECHNRPRLAGQDRLSVDSVLPDARGWFYATNSPDWAGENGSTTSHLESPKPTRASAQGNYSVARLFLRSYFRIRTGDPVLGPLPGNRITLDGTLGFRPPGSMKNIPEMSPAYVFLDQNILVLAEYSSQES